MITPTQLEIIRNYYPVTDVDEVARMAGLSARTVAKYAKRMGLKNELGGPNRRWSTNELNFLRATCKTLTVGEIAKRLGRSEAAIVTMASKLQLNPVMGRKPITLPPADMQWLIDNYPYRTNADIAARLNIKVATVTHLARKHDLHKWRSIRNK